MNIKELSVLYAESRKIYTWTMGQVSFAKQALQHAKELEAELKELKGEK